MEVAIGGTVTSMTDKENYLLTQKSPSLIRACFSACLSKYVFEYSGEY